MWKATLNGTMAAVAALLTANAVPASAQRTAEQGLLNRSLSFGSNFGGQVQSVTGSDMVQESVDGARALLGITARAGGAANISRSRQQRTPGVTGVQALLGRTEGDSREATVSSTAGVDPTYPSSEQALLGQVRDLIGATGGTASAWYSIESGEVALLGKR